MAALHVCLLLSALGASGDVVLLDFTAPWCGPCQQMKPTVERLAAAGYPVKQVDFDANRQLAQQCGVDRIPAFIMVRDGRVVEKKVGYTAYPELVQMFDKAGFSLNQNLAQTPAPSAQTLPITPVSAPAKAAAPPYMAQQYAEPAATPPAASFAGQPSSQYNEFEQAAMNASVRLKVDDASGHSFATGTIIDVHGDEALVLTCGHVFRDSAGKGKITADFCGGGLGSVPGQLISYDAETHDIGLVSIRSAASVKPVKVAGLDYRPAQTAPVFTIGCDRGGPALLKRSRISAINRYAGPDNYEVTGQPVSGRSGGGLFSADGYLIGVCNAADPSEDEGIYAALPSVQAQLARIGQERIFSTTAPSEQSLAQAAAPLSSGAQVTPAIYTEPVDASEETEVIIVIRSKHDKRGETLTIDRPSNDLLQRIRSEQRQQGPGLRAGVDGGSRILPTDHRTHKPIVRGQNG